MEVRQPSELLRASELKDEIKSFKRNYDLDKIEDMEDLKELVFQHMPNTSSLFFVDFDRNPKGNRFIIPFGVCPACMKASLFFYKLQNKFWKQVTPRMHEVSAKVMNNEKTQNT